ncbi:PilZ domain-containing protein [Sphingomonas sp. M1-B02]|uniref:PilZ domain-containing protein n=1 Tax=Sphingomonas sp. M1-B02 TaxID=3114300 RepID=UPI00223F7190|nr:PilZ domain-containing protein [Sphingomonas sp. S6-11]UZK67113.1 PilZ domain-containing protein [Sphingomonas sp. S6-11]
MTQPLRSATIFSLAADPPRALLDRAEPHAELDSACLVGAEMRLPCALQKLSAAGATLAIEAELQQHEEMHLELANGQSLAGKVDWCADGEAGFLFDAPIDVIGTLARNLVNLPDERRTMPRVEIHQTIFVRAGAQVELARTRNISQGGVGIDTRLALSRDDKIEVTFDGLRPLEGVIRWIQDGQAGVEFEEGLGWQTLMPWLRNVQRIRPAPAPPPIGSEPASMIPDKHAIPVNSPASIREGARWWNARVRALTTHLIELETQASVLPGAQLWISLPEIGGGPASVVEAGHGRILCEFRLPLRPRELGLLTGGRLTP